MSIVVWSLAQYTGSTVPYVIVAGRPLRLRNQWQDGAAQLLAQVQPMAWSSRTTRVQAASSAFQSSLTRRARMVLGNLRCLVDKSTALDVERMSRGLCIP